MVGIGDSQSFDEIAAKLLLVSHPLAKAKKLGDTEEGSQLSLLHSMTEELKDQPWYVQAAASKLIPVIQKAADNQDKPKVTKLVHGKFGFD